MRVRIEAERLEWVARGRCGGCRIKVAAGRRVRRCACGSRVVYQ